MGDNELIRVGFSRRQADAIQAEIGAAGGGGGGEGGGGFGGVLRAHNNAIDYTHAGSPVSHSIRPKSWVFDDYTSGHGGAAFALSAAADDPNAFGTNISGWYLVRVQVWVRFTAAVPETVALQGAGYYGDNLQLETGTGPNGGGPGSPGARIDFTWGPVWIPALGVDGDRSGYFYSRLDWVHSTEAPIELFSGNLPFTHYVSLLGAT